ncbi:MAG: DUF4240 domain-containing protein, partial [Bacteroidia bacterium]|nr:DUF4240 domain-containing protein [Bacteroidia bacterium]
MIDQARQSSTNKWELAENVAKILSTKNIENLIGFDYQLRRLLQNSYRQELWCVAHVACGGCSIENFEYFRAWMIGQGKEV